MAQVRDIFANRMQAINTPISNSAPSIQQQQAASMSNRMELPWAEMKRRRAQQRQPRRSMGGRRRENLSKPMTNRDRATPFQQMKAGMAGRMNSRFANAYGRTAQNAYRGFQAGPRQGRGGRQPVFSREDMMRRQSMMNTQGRGVTDRVRRRPLFANRSGMY